MANIKSSIYKPALLLIAGLFAVSYWQRTALADWIKLQGYQPPAGISRLADEDTMTPAARHIYYINHPKLVASAQDFAKSCPQIEQTVVLGCYQASENGIYLRIISDSRLNGVEEVTAAHEMLHGAYDRLNQKDKDNIDALLLNFFNNGLVDQRIKDTINSYKQSEPNDVVDEMHSIFGTEIANLPPQLESYYKKYFTNRPVVASFTANYEQEFTSRIAGIKNYEQQLNSLKSKIDAEEASLSLQSSQIQRDRARLESLRSSGQITQYNAAVPGFNQEIDSYNTGVSQLKSDISSYNSIVILHNQLADELRVLYTALGTGLSQQPGN